jgi:hypothetical protein
VAITLIVVLAVGMYPLVRLGTREIFQAAVLGMLIAAANVMAGWAAIEYSWSRSATVFLKVVLGGMAVRMLVMAGVIAALIKLFGVHTGGLVVSLAMFYVIFLTLEVLFIQRRSVHRQES